MAYHVNMWRMVEDVFSRRQLADYLRVSYRTVIRWENDGRGPAWHQVGKQIRYRRSDVERWLERHRHDGKDT